MHVANYRKLEFEREAVDDMMRRGEHVLRSTTRPRRRIGRMWLFVPIVGLVAAVGVYAGSYAYGSLGAFWLWRDSRAINELSVVLLHAMVEGRMEDALAVCPEGSVSGQTLFAEEQRVFLPELARSIHANQDAVQARVEQLSEIRKELESQGVDWHDVTPVAFGGIRARVLDSTRMREPATALVGNIYFKSAGKIFAIELSAWRCKDSYVLVDIWQGIVVPADADALEQFTHDRYQDFPKDTPDGNRTQVDRVTHLFVRL